MGHLKRKFTKYQKKDHPEKVINFRGKSNIRCRAVDDSNEDGETKSHT